MRVATTISLGAAVDRLAVLQVKTKCMPPSAVMNREVAELSRAIGEALAQTKGANVEQAGQALANVHIELFHFENAAAKLATMPADDAAIRALYGVYLHIRSLNSERHRIVARIDGADAEPKVYR